MKCITRLAFLNSDVATFFYAVRDVADENNVHCHVYCTTQPDEVRYYIFCFISLDFSFNDLILVVFIRKCFIFH